VETGDLVTLIGGFIVVLIVAVIINPGSLVSLFGARPSNSTPASPVPVVTTAPVPVISGTIPVPVPNPNATLTSRPQNTPYRIYYTSNPFIHPVVTLPENMNPYGTSDITLNPTDYVTFAYIEESRGGLTQNFTVPYGIWTMNITVVAERLPQYAVFRMALRDAKTGALITGAEIVHGGTLFRNVQVSNTAMYLIISTQNVDRFRIELETPDSYYEMV
jgi:hypothetical protein